jgi:hypothetical protein
VVTDRSNLERAHRELAEAEERCGKIETALERSLSPGIAERREKAERVLAEARNSEPDSGSRPWSKGDRARLRWHRLKPRSRS